MPRALLLGLVAASVCGCGISPGSIARQIILPEQRSIDYNDPARLPAAPIPDNIAPRTVADPRPATEEWRLSLDEAIRVALENAQVIRVLAGTTVVASGQTIYDAAVTNTTIDQAQARFDPVLSENSTWSRTNTPFGQLDPFNPTQATISSLPTDAYSSNFGLGLTNVLGGQWQANWMENPTRFDVATGSATNVVTSSTIGLPLNPENPTTVTLSYTQPLLQGAGFQVNTAPIAIARLNTEQSYYQYKDSVQQMVLGVITAYWNLVQSRTDLFARQKQVELQKFVVDLAEAKLAVGLGDGPAVAQARVSYNQFVANRIAAEAAVLTQEGVLRNILGLPPEDDRRIVPVSAPAGKQLRPDWKATVNLAEQRRPDIVELKLLTEADRVRLLQASNQALPTLNAVAMYTFNGLSGDMPDGERIATPGAQYTNWSVGLNFSVPLGLRQGRAGVRQQRLVIARDGANVNQAIHAALHLLAGTVRDLDSAYQQYLAYVETRKAADENVKAQFNFKTFGTLNALAELQALNDWGNAVSSEAQQLLAYNIALATLEEQTGTILETHGLVFVEERFRAAGPLVLPCLDPQYPSSLVPNGEPTRYPSSGEPSENAFDLRDPRQSDPKMREMLPPPNPIPPGK
jgi:outer membrane protein TolC